MTGIILRWTALFFLSLAVQATLMPVVAIRGITPDLPLVVLFFFSLRFGILPGLYTGFLVGLCQDLYAPTVLGQLALAKTVTGFVMGIFNERVMRTDPLIKALLLVVVIAGHDAIFSLVDVIKHDIGAAAAFLPILTHSIPRALYSLVVVGLVYVWQQFAGPSLFRR